MSKKWSSSDKDRLLVENFKKFMNEEDFSPIAEAEVKVEDFFHDRYRRFSSVPVGVLTSVIIDHREQLEQMTKEEGIAKIAGLIDSKEDAGLVKLLKGNPLSSIMTKNGGLPGFVEWFLGKEEEQGRKLVNFTDDETGDEIDDEELYKDIYK